MCYFIYYVSKKKECEIFTSSGVSVIVFVMKVLAKILIKEKIKDKRCSKGERKMLRLPLTIINR